jgi:hypothetical protein
MQLSEHFTLEELKKTTWNFPNEPDEASIKNLEALCKNVLEPIRELLGCSLRITSGYRSQRVNQAVGGVPSSQHRLGQAADFVPISQDAIHLELQFEAIRQSDIPYWQLILEFGWIHVSFIAGQEPKRQALIAYKDGGKISYKAVL